MVCGGVWQWQVLYGRYVARRMALATHDVGDARANAICRGWENGGWGSVNGREGGDGMSE